jgi:AraC family transcriptional regulator, melibiose operon regulatory protein
MPFSDILRTYDSKRPELLPYGLECDKWKPELMWKSDRHNEIEINYVVDGSFTYLIKGKKVRIEANTIAIFWALFPHQIIEKEEDCLYYTVTIPFKRFMQFEWPAIFVNNILSGQFFLCEGSNPEIETCNFERWYADLKEHKTESEKVALLEIYGRIYRIAHTISNSHEKAYLVSNQGELTLAEKMAIYIASNYQNEIDVADIARQAGIHPDYANRIFKKSFNQTLKDFLTEQRIIHSQRMLLTTKQKVIEIAFASGFKSLSRFNATFKSICKCTPKDYKIKYL